MRLITASLLLLVSAAGALADDANWAVIGSAGSLKPNRQIQMVREDVQISLDHDDMHVRATFWFRNHGGATDVTMAFPDETSTSNHDYKTHVYGNLIRRFSSSVDGVPVSVHRERVASKQPMDFKSVWLKKVVFKAGQARRVVVDYVATQGFAGNGWVFNTYVLETGATWAGRIESCRLTVDWSKLWQYSRPTLDLMGKVAPHAEWKSLGLRRRTVELRHIKPHFNLDLTMVTGFFNFHANGRSLDLGHGLPDDNGGPLLSGSLSDLLIPVDNLDHFFYGSSRWDRLVHVRKGKPLRGWVAVDGGRLLRFANHRELRLSRGVQSCTYEHQPYKAVYLRDVVQALGGHYRAVPLDERVDLRLPGRWRVTPLAD
jgi:hypothetical protein